YSSSGGDKGFQRKVLETWSAGNAKDKPPRPAADAAAILDPMRLVKDPLEQDLLREASRISADAHRAAMARAAVGRHEWDLKAAIGATCLSRGAARLAYPPTVASGKTSGILHYERDDQRLE